MRSIDLVALGSAALLGVCLPVLALDTPQLAIEAAVSGDSVQVQLSWNPVSGASAYKLFERQEPADLLVLSTAQTSANVALANLPGAANNLMTQYYVVALGEVGLPNMITVPAGSFTQGQSGLVGSVPEHSVTLTRGFQMGAFPVTNGEYIEALQWAWDNRATTGISVNESYGVYGYGQLLYNFHSDSNEIYWIDSSFVAGPALDDDAFDAYPQGYFAQDHPVIEVTWYGAACYCDWRSMMEGLTPFYQGDWSLDTDHNPYLAEGYRLPMEAEWEYAARYNDGRHFPWGNATPNCGYLNYFSPLGQCVGWTTPVGDYGMTSALGFYDLAGNVREWCGDFWGTYSTDGQVDPLGPASSSWRVVRGCGWPWNVDHAWCAYRSNSYPHYGQYYVGMRIARTVTN